MKVVVRKALSLMLVLGMLFVLACASSKSVAVSPSTIKKQDRYLDAVGEDWVDDQKQTSEENTFIEDDFKLTG